MPALNGDEPRGATMGGLCVAWQARTARESVREDTGSSRCGEARFEPWDRTGGKKGRIDTCSRCHEAGEGGREKNGEG